MLAALMRKERKSGEGQGGGAHMEGEEIGSGLL
jgi:hypothetical protein